MLSLRITEEAQSHLDDIRDYTFENFGSSSMDLYDHLIRTVFLQLQSDPTRIGVDSTIKGLSKYHISFSKRDAELDGQIVDSPKHWIVFQVDESRALEIVGVIHDTMLIEKHL